MIYFVNCNWVDTRWQQYSTCIEQHNETEYTEQSIHNNKNT